MGQLAERRAGGTRLVPKEKTTKDQLIAADEIDPDEEIYEITSNGFKKLNEDDQVQPGKDYGVIPSPDLGA